MIVTKTLSLQFDGCSLKVYIDSTINMSASIFELQLNATCIGGYKTNSPFFMGRHARNSKQVA